MEKRKIPVEEGKLMKKGDVVTREFLDNDSNRFRACIPVAGLKKESWLAHE